jgi:hypothetical protein
MGFSFHESRALFEKAKGKGRDDESANCREAIMTQSGQAVTVMVCELV